MEAEIHRLLDTLADLREKADVNTCFGEPVTVGDRTVIPVASTGYGFGMGLGKGSTTSEPGELSDEGMEGLGIGGRGGGGMAARPLAAIEVTPEGTRVDPIVDAQKVAVVGILVGGWIIFWLARALIGVFGQRE